MLNVYYSVKVKVCISFDPLSSSQYSNSNDITMLLLTFINNCEVHTAKYSDRSFDVRTE